MALLITIIALALLFDYINGFHDAANSIATIVSTKVLTPLWAVVWAASFNFIAFFISKYVIGEFGIANTVSKVVFEQFITLPVILSGLLAAITWNLLTWWFGIPSSSSHTLIGGFGGAALAGTLFNTDAIRWFGSKGVIEIASFIILAPLIGMLLSILITNCVYWICRKANPHKCNKWFKRLQLVSAGLFSIGHGMNDSQKVMGIIAAALFAYGSLHTITDIPTWVPLSCHAAIALGTLSGGWRIIKTMGTRITKVTPIEGVVAETAGAITLYLTEVLHIPVSTTHTITGAIIGAGAVKRLTAVRWGITINLLWAWFLTIPVSALLAAGYYFIVNLVLN